VKDGDKSFQRGGHLPKRELIQKTARTEVRKVKEMTYPEWARRSFLKRAGRGLVCWACGCQRGADVTAERRKEIVAMPMSMSSCCSACSKRRRLRPWVRSDISPKFLGTVLFGMIVPIYPWYQPEVDVRPGELGFILADLFMMGVGPKAFRDDVTF
jgi:hypothetical protein